MKDIGVWEKFESASIEAGKHELAYSVSHLLENNEVSLLNAKIRSATKYTLKAIMEGQLTIETAIVHYKTGLSLAGIQIQDEIEKLNDMIIAE